MIYSAHDDQVDNMEVWLNPQNYEMDFVKFASQVFFELSYSKECIASESAGEDCFHVDILYNGADLSLSECSGSVVSETGCSYTHFKDLMHNIWYNGQDADNLDLACEQTYDPLPY